MRRLFLLASSILVLVFSGCGDGSLPNATGKGSIRAINAIPTSPSIEFLIEQRIIGNVDYKDSSVAVVYDDLDYVFNFRVQPADQIVRETVASQPLTIVANTQYTFLISGALAAPTITIWEKEIQQWTASDTVFAVQFGHAAASLGTVDVYFAPPGVAPVLGEQRGTLSFTEVLAPLPVEAGDYVLTLTAANDPSIVMYTSDSVAYLSQTAPLLNVYDGDANDTSLFTVRRIEASGTSDPLPDANSISTMQFVQASMALATSDIYDDVALTTPIVVDHAYTDISNDIDMSDGLTDFTYTATGNVSSVLYERNISVLGGSRGRFVVIGADAATLTSVYYLPDGRPVATLAKFTFMNAASNYDLVDVYLVKDDLSITDLIPELFGVGFGNVPARMTLDAGTYKMYVTPIGEKTVLAGPITIDAALGDIIDTLAVDTVDPSTAQVLFIP